MGAVMGCGDFGLWWFRFIFVKARESRGGKKESRRSGRGPPLGHVIGPVNLNKLTQRMAELDTNVTNARERKRQIETKKLAVLRRLSRKAGRESVKTLKPGRPKK